MTPEQPSNLPDIRASDTDREAAADRVKLAAAEGRLDSSELDKRLGAVYAARWQSELSAATVDITPPPQPPAPRPQPPANQSVNGLAIASLASALLWLFWVGSIVGIVCGHMALSEINRGKGTGSGLAIAGLVVGYLSLLPLLFILFPVILFFL